MHGWLLLGLYGLIAIMPLGLAYSLGWSLRSWHQELASILGLVGYALLLMEFVLSGRFRTVSGRIGMDRTMRFHQVMARVLTVFLLLHPFLYLGPFNVSHPWDETRVETILLSGPGLLTGVAAWLLLGLTVLLAVGRGSLPFCYEAWRLSHGLGSALLAGLAAHHALALGRYSQTPAMALFWLVLLGLAVVTLAWIYLAKPLLLKRRSCHITAVRPVALRIWEVELNRPGNKRLHFEAGQFAWVRLDCSPWSLREHPFSYASAPSELPCMRFLVKESGDFTNRIGQLQSGRPAFVDGPYGNLTLKGLPAAKLVFIAGGVGVAPMLSLLRQLRIDNDTRPLQLIYGNRVAEQICHATELEGMARDLNLKVNHVLGEPPEDWSGVSGQLNTNILSQLLDQPAAGGTFYLLCGPPLMIRSVLEALATLGVPRKQVRTERFSYD